MKVEGNVLQINMHLAQCIGLIIFMSGLMIAFAFRPAPLDVKSAYTMLDARMSIVELECKKPQKGEVRVTAEDVLDAVRGKPLEFVVKTKVKG